MYRGLRVPMEEVKKKKSFSLFSFFLDFSCRLAHYYIRLDFSYSSPSSFLLCGGLGCSASWTLICLSLTPRELDTEREKMWALLLCGNGMQIPQVSCLSFPFPPPIQHTHTRLWLCCPFKKKTCHSGRTASFNSLSHFVSFSYIHFFHTKISEN